MKDMRNRRLFGISNAVRGIAHKSSQIGFTIVKIKTLIDPDKNNHGKINSITKCAGIITKPNLLYFLFMNRLLNNSMEPIRTDARRICCLIRSIKVDGAYS